MLTESKKDSRLFEILSSEEKMEFYLKSHGKDVKKIDPIIWNIHFNIPEKKRMAVLNKYVGELFQKQKTSYNFLTEHMIQARLYDLLRVPYTMVMKKNSNEYSIKLTKNSNHRINTLKKYYNRKPKAQKPSNLEQFDFVEEKNLKQISFSCFRRIQKENRSYLAQSLSSPLAISNEKSVEPISKAVVGIYENCSKNDDQQPIMELAVRFPRKCKQISLYNVREISKPTISQDRENLIEQPSKDFTVENTILLNQDAVASTITLFPEKSPISEVNQNIQNQKCSKKMSLKRDKKKQSSPYSTSNHSNISDEFLSSIKSPTHLKNQHNLIQRPSNPEHTEILTSPYSTSNCSDIVDELVSPVKSSKYSKNNFKITQPYVEESPKTITNNKQITSTPNVDVTPDFSRINLGCETIPNNQKRIYYEELSPKSDGLPVSPYSVSNYSDFSDKFSIPIKNPARYTDEHTLIEQQIMEQSLIVDINEESILSIQPVTRTSSIFSKNYGSRKSIPNSQKRIYYEKMSSKNDVKSKTTISNNSDTSNEFFSPPTAITNNKEIPSPSDVIISPNFSRKSNARKTTPSSQKLIHKKSKITKKKQISLSLDRSRSSISNFSEDEFVSPIKSSASRCNSKKIIFNSVNELKNKENLIPMKNEIKIKNTKLKCVSNPLKKSTVSLKSYDISTKSKKIDTPYDYFNAEDKYGKSKPFSIKKRTTLERNNSTSSSKNKDKDSSCNKKANYSIQKKTIKSKVNLNRVAIEPTKNPTWFEDEETDNSNSYNEEVHALRKNKNLNGDIINKKKFLSRNTEFVIQSKNLLKKHNKSKINLDKSVSKHIDKRILLDDSDSESSSSKKNDVSSGILNCYEPEVQQKSTEFISEQHNDLDNVDFSVEKIFQDVSNWKNPTVYENNCERSKKRNSILNNILGLSFLSETSSEESPEIMYNKNVNFFSDENFAVEQLNSAITIRSQPNQSPSQKVGRSQSSNISQQQLVFDEVNENSLFANVRNESNDYDENLDKEKVQKISSLFIDYDSDNGTTTPGSSKSSLNNYEEIMSAIKFRESLNNEVDFEIFKADAMSKKQRAYDKEMYSSATIHPKSKQISSQQEIELTIENYPNYKEQQWDSLPDSLESSLTSADEKLDLVRQKLLNVCHWYSSE